MKNILLILMVSFLSLSIEHSYAKESEGQKIEYIKSVIKKYRKSKVIKMKVKKKLVQELLGKEVLSEGHLYFSKGRLRMEIEKPEHSLLVMDGKTIWVETQLPDMGGKVQVAKLKASGKKKKSRGLLAVLLEKESVWDSFKILKNDNKKSMHTYLMEPKNKKDMPEILKISLSLDKKENQITNISYWDELENKTSFDFSDIDFGVTVTKNFFKYTPPKNADVTEY